MKNNKNMFWVWLVAGITAVAGIAVAVALFVKRAGKKFQKDLDFDDSIYFEDDETALDDVSDDEIDAEDVLDEEDESKE
ncbi:MAG: hypothetical protein ACOX6U_02905 [Oscillospiraceae bacterium]|jgi:hypothetical protein